MTMMAVSRDFTFQVGDGIAQDTELKSQSKSRLVDILGDT